MGRNLRRVRVGSRSSVVVAAKENNRAALEWTAEGGCPHMSICDGISAS